MLYFLLVLAIKLNHAHSQSCYDQIRDGNYAQVAFLVDRNLPQLNDAVHQGVVESLRSKEAVVYAGIASYGKFKSSSQTDDCFKVEEAFTRNPSSIQQAVSEVISDAGNGPNSPLSAAAFTAASGNIAWHTGKRSDGGKVIRRLIVFYTEEGDSITTSIDSKNRFEGNGTDNCKGRGPLSYADVRRTLKEHDVAVLALLSSAELKRIYDLYFYTFGVPYCSAVYSGEGLARTIKIKVDECLRAVSDCSGLNEAV